MEGKGFKFALNWVFWHVGVACFVVLLEFALVMREFHIVLLTSDLGLPRYAPKFIASSKFNIRIQFVKGI